MNRPDDPTEPLGWVSYAGGMILAELLGVDRWRVTVGGVDDPAKAATLVARYRGAYQGPADGYYGQTILRDLAALTGGVSWFDQPSPLPYGSIP
jgi:hypothetical protein